MDRRRVFGIGLVAGGASAGILVAAAAFGALIGVPLLVIGFLMPPRAYAAAGTLIGFGAIVTLLFWRVGNACIPPECAGPSTSIFVAAGLACLAIGVGLLVVAWLRDRR